MLHCLNHAVVVNRLLIAAFGGNDNTFTKIRTATNKQLGFNSLASQRKVKLLRNRISTIDRDDWLESKEMLYKLKQGQNAKKQTETCVMKVKNLKAYIQKFVISESDNLTHLQDGDKLKICYDADAGGGRNLQSSMEKIRASHFIHFCCLRGPMSEKTLKLCFHLSQCK